MPQENLTPHIRRGIKKHFEDAGQWEEKKEQRKQIAADKASRKGPPPRDRRWDDAPVESDAPVALERRRQAATEREADASAVIATVVEIRAADCLLSIDGAQVRGLLPHPGLLAQEGMRSPLAVGDRVEVTLAEPTLARILRRLPRESALVRNVRDSGRTGGAFQGQVLAANIDQVVVVCTPQQPPFRPGLIDRYLVAAGRDNLPVVLCVNKTDLGVPDDVAEYLDGYRALGLGVCEVSAATGAGLDALEVVLAGRTSLLTGHSGVGKSSLINALRRDDALRVGGVTETVAGQGKGRHTTTSSTLIPLGPDTVLVDSPGIRAYSVQGLRRGELAAFFPDIAEAARGCAYRDCTHGDEQGCVVVPAPGPSAFLRQRLASYRSIWSELN